MASDKEDRRWGFDGDYPHSSPFHYLRTASINSVGRSHNH